MISSQKLIKWFTLGWRYGFTTLAMIAVLAVVGCGGDDASNVVPETQIAADNDAVKLSAETFDLQMLLDHPNGMISNNAKQLQSAINANDYAKATQSVMYIAGVRDVNEVTAENVRKALSHVRDVVRSAVEQGDPNAQYALDRLNDAFGN